ncbi:MAG: hypothetical protein NC131_15585 [Roseburia sp.]|nr:hypothetical protein [Roseburia sp.]
MKITALNEDIPSWLKPHMKKFCECGVGVFVDDGPIGYDGVMKLTQRWCSNPKCPYHMAEKVNMLAKYFGIDGVGAKTALQDILMYKFTSHLDALKFWYAEPPEVYLYQAAELSYIYGVDSKWKDWFGKYSTIDDYLQNTTYVPEVVLDNLEYLRECISYFRIKKEGLSGVVIKVMLTGSMHGYSSRSEFLAAINAHYKGVLRVEDNKKTVRDTVCLVKEPDSVDYSKTQIALDHNIPIVSSEEFLAILESLGGEKDEDT